MSKGWTVLKQAENELLTQVGPCTAIGAVMRRYWIPVLLCEEVPDPDGDPVRVADGFRRIDTTGHTILPARVDAHVAAVMCGAELQTRDVSAFGSFFIDQFLRFGANLAVRAVCEGETGIPGLICRYGYYGDLAPRRRTARPGHGWDQPSTSVDAAWSRCASTAASRAARASWTRRYASEPSRRRRGGSGARAASIIAATTLACSPGICSSGTGVRSAGVPR